MLIGFNISTAAVGNIESIIPTSKVPSNNAEGPHALPLLAHLERTDGRVVLDQVRFRSDSGHYAERAQGELPTVFLHGNGVRHCHH